MIHQFFIRNVRIFMDFLQKSKINVVHYIATFRVQYTTLSRRKEERGGGEMDFPHYGTYDDHLRKIDEEQAERRRQFAELQKETAQARLWSHVALALSVLSLFVDIML